jgi:hypothetical protein
MTATLGTCKNSIKEQGWEHDTVQIMGEWEVMETYPYLLLKTQGQVFTAGSTKGCLLFFSSFALGPIYLLLKIDS